MATIAIPEWLKDLLVGTLLIVLGIVMAELWHKIRGKNDPPTAEEIARADYELKQKRENEIHAVAHELYEILGAIRSHSASWTGGLVQQHMPEVGFEKAAAEVQARWFKVKPRLEALQRDDIPREAEEQVERFRAASNKLAENLKPLRGIPKQMWGHDLRDFTGDLIGVKYQAESVQGKVEPYRRRFLPPA